MTTTLIPSADLDTSPIDWTVSGVVPRTGTGYVWGPPGSGKSLAFGVELALAVANGTPFFGREVIAGPVVYALGEGLPGTGVRKQARLARQARDDTAAIAAVARDHGDAAARALSAGLPAYDDSRVSILAEPFDVRLTAKGEISATMREAIAAIGALGEAPELVILDAAGDFTGGAGLSSDSVANHFAAGLKALAAALDCVVLVIAHPTASNAKMLGAGRLVAAADFVIEVQPDAAAAPGAAQTATVTSRKSKDGAGFDPFGYVLEPATWTQPAEDDHGEVIPGETVTVTSATVRLLQSAPARPPGTTVRPPAALPVLQDTTRPEAPRKRSGIRNRLSPVPDLAGARARRDLTAGILSVPCPDCRALAGGMGCDVSVRGSGLVPLSLDPVLAVHNDRVLDAAEAGRVDLDEALAWLAGVTPAQVPAPAPEPPASGRNAKLWWTTVRPGKAG